MNRNLSIRRRESAGARNRFSISTLRGLQQPELSKKLNRLIKNENVSISAHEKAGRERVSIASQLSEWGDSTEDDAVSDISDKLGVLMAEIGEQEDVFAQNLEDYRGLLKHIRDTESSVQPSRDQRAKVADDIQKLKWKDPNSPKLETLEQELVRSEAQNLVAEAQLTNMTRQKLKEAFDVHLAAVVERSEKQALLARHARRLLNLVDDTPVVPGDGQREYERAAEAKQVLDDAEKDLLNWECTLEPIQTSAGQLPSSTLLPTSARRSREAQASGAIGREAEETAVSESARDADEATEATREGGSSLRGDAEDFNPYAPSYTGGTDGYAQEASQLDDSAIGSTGGAEDIVPETTSSDVVPEATRETDLKGAAQGEADAAREKAKEAPPLSAQPIAVPY